jgi:peptidoglycan/xylan/chitin deacetylase (PgdA/CDA1 family)
MASLEHRLEHQQASLQTQDISTVLGTNTVEGKTVSTDTEDPSEMLHTDDVAVSTIPVDINADNLAEEGDVHRVYLTFDDGPSSNTSEILDILSEYDVKATFFVSGKEDDESKELYQRIVNEGHTLGMHSYSNKYSVIYQSQEAFEEDYQKLYDYLYEVTGQECRYYRFPGGSSNQISNVPMGNLIEYLNQQQTVYFDWNVSAGDAASSAYTSAEIVENVMQDVVKYKTSVVLLHDSQEQSATVAAIGPLIEALQEIDAEILPIDEDTPVIQYVKAEGVE